MRIENLVEVIVDESPGEGNQKFFRFSTATLCPIDTRLIDKTLLTAEEIEFLNAYHQRVERELSPHLNEDDLVWLKKVTQAI